MSADEQKTAARPVIVRSLPGHLLRATAVGVTAGGLLGGAAALVATALEGVPGGAPLVAFCAAVGAVGGAMLGMVIGLVTLRWRDGGRGPGEAVVAWGAAIAAGATGGLLAGGMWSNAMGDTTGAGIVLGVSATVAAAHRCARVGLQWVLAPKRSPGRFSRR